MPRSFNDYMDSILDIKIPLLDHGYIIPVDYLGDEQAIVDAARTSYGDGTSHTRGNVGLLRYLLRHRHTTPYEQADIKFELKMPIFVARQWIRHRTAKLNEYSGRYSIMAEEFYIPELEQMAPQSKTNMQGRETDGLNLLKAQMYRGQMETNSKGAFDFYRYLTTDNEDEADQLTRELARIGLPLSTYTKLVWKIDVHNWMHFLSLRADSHAQYEIRVYADAMLTILAGWMPNVYSAFISYVKDAVTLSSEEVHALLNASTVDISMLTTGLNEAGVSKREQTALMQILTSRGVNRWQAGELIDPLIVKL